MKGANNHFSESFKKHRCRKESRILFVTELAMASITAAGVKNLYRSTSIYYFAEYTFDPE